MKRAGSDREPKAIRRPDGIMDSKLQEILCNYLDSGIDYNKIVDEVCANYEGAQAKCMVLSYFLNLVLSSEYDTQEKVDEEIHSVIENAFENVLMKSFNVELATFIPKRDASLVLKMVGDLSERRFWNELRQKYPTSELLDHVCKKQERLVNERKNAKVGSNSKKLKRELNRTEDIDRVDDADRFLRGIGVDDDGEHWKELNDEYLEPIAFVKMLNDVIDFGLKQVQEVYEHAQERVEGNGEFVNMNLVNKMEKELAEKVISMVTFNDKISMTAFQLLINSGPLIASEVDTEWSVIRDEIMDRILDQTLFGIPIQSQSYSNLIFVSELAELNELDRENPMRIAILTVTEFAAHRASILKHCEMNYSMDKVNPTIESVPNQVFDSISALINELESSNDESIPHLIGTLRCQLIMNGFLWMIYSQRLRVDYDSDLRVHVCKILAWILYPEDAEVREYFTLVFIHSSKLCARYSHDLTANRFGLISNGLKSAMRTSAVVARGVLMWVEYCLLEMDKTLNLEKLGSCLMKELCELVLTMYPWMGEEVFMILKAAFCQFHTAEIADQLKHVGKTEVRLIAPSRHEKELESETLTRSIRLFWIRRMVDLCAFNSQLSVLVVEFVIEHIDSFNDSLLRTFFLRLVANIKSPFSKEFAEALQILLETRKFIDVISKFNDVQCQSQFYAVLESINMALT